jgi:hypothetical protein
MFFLFGLLIQIKIEKKKNNRKTCYQAVVIYHLHVYFHPVGQMNPATGLPIITTYNQSQIGNKIT